MKKNGKESWIGNAMVESEEETIRVQRSTSVEIPSDVVESEEETSTVRIIVMRDSCYYITPWK